MHATKRALPPTSLLQPSGGFADSRDNTSAYLNQIAGPELALVPISPYRLCSRSAQPRRTTLGHVDVRCMYDFVRSR